MKRGAVVVAVASVAALGFTAVTADAGGLFGDGGLFRGTIGEIFDPVEEQVLTPMAQGAAVAGGAALGAAGAAYVGAPPQMGGMIGACAGQVVNEAFAGQARGACAEQMARDAGNQAIMGAQQQAAWNLGYNQPAGGGNAYSPQPYPGYGSAPYGIPGVSPAVPPQYQAGLTGPSGGAAPETYPYPGHGAPPYGGPGVSPTVPPEYQAGRSEPGGYTRPTPPIVCPLNGSVRLVEVGSGLFRISIPVDDGCGPGWRNQVPLSIDRPSPDMIALSGQPIYGELPPPIPAPIPNQGVICKTSEGAAFAQQGAIGSACLADFPWVRGVPGRIVG